MNDSIKDTLDQLMGETKVYEGKEYTFDKYKQVNDVVTIQTNRRTFVFTYMEIERFFRNLKEPNHKEFFPSLQDQEIENEGGKNVQVTTSNVTVNGYSPSAENVTLKSSLLNVLEQLNTDSSEKNIEKARAVCEVANTMVNIQKAEIQMIRTLKHK